MLIVFKEAHDAFEYDCMVNNEFSMGFVYVCIYVCANYYSDISYFHVEYKRIFAKFTTRICMWFKEFLSLRLLEFEI